MEWEQLSGRREKKSREYTLRRDGKHVETVDGGREIEAGQGSASRGRERNTLGIPVPVTNVADSTTFSRPDQYRTNSYKKRCFLCLI